MNNNLKSFGDLQGRTLQSVENLGDEMIFELEDGSKYRLYHDQSCCEDVRIEDVSGDLGDLVGTPILLAEEVESQTPEHLWDESDNESDVSETWTYYRIRTIKGTISIRWYGTSNGYYSESVNWGRLS